MTGDPQLDFTSRYEGVVPHCYLDSEGNVTAGIGFKLASEADVKPLPWTPSTPSALADWRLVKSAEGGHTAGFYRSMTVARLSEADMRSIFATRMAAFRARLQHDGWRLERHPLCVQIALLDMAYNLGVAGLTKFHLLRMALDERAYQVAADECHRQRVQPSRNADTRMLMLSALSVG